MSFAEHTGRTKRGNCAVCGVEVDQEEVCMTAGRLPAGTTWWESHAHKAPCGAQCSGGGTDPDELDVHIPTFGSCPRCGATESEIARVIDRADGNERVVFHHYVMPHCASIGYRIDLEQRIGNEWRVKSRWNSNHPDSLQLTIEWAKRYVPWLAVCDLRDS